MGISDIKSRRETIESALIFKWDLALATKPGCPKPPEPKGGRREIIKMILKNNEQEYLVWVLLDFGARIPILKKSWAQKHKIPTSRRAEPRLVENFASKIELHIGLANTYPVRLKHTKHICVESCEIGPTDDECDAILPF
jgi:hypothetical protein